jgi:hypothetical protein
MMNPVYSDRSDMFALGCTFYELCNLRPAYTSAARPFVPEMSAAARLEYGSRLSPLVTNLMQLFPVLRPSTQQLVAGLEAYCVSRWQKQHTTSLWQGLAVLAKAYQQHQVAQVQAAQVQAVQQAQVQMQIQAAAQAQVQMQMQAAAQAQAYQAAAQVQQAQAMAGMQAYQYQMQAQAQAQARAQAQAQAMQMAALQQRPRQQFGFNPWNPGFPF